MVHRVDRRSFLAVSAAALGGAIRPFQDPDGASASVPAREPLYRISLAQWSLHRALFGRTEPKLAVLDFPRVAKELGFGAVEYVNQFFKDRARDEKFLAELAKVCDGEGVQSLLVMCDGEGRLGDPDEGKRRQAVENHHRWVAAAKRLGCHSIRVNAASSGSRAEQQKLAADGLHALCEFADGHEVNVLVENHGGLSSDGGWLAGVMKAVDHPRCGTLPDFGNFRIRRGEEYDRYRGVAELMGWAKAVSAKSHDFDEDGEETHTDYGRMMKIVVDAGYRGFVGVEYEGDGLSERDGILATRRLLERVRESLL